MRIAWRKVRAPTTRYSPPPRSESVAAQPKTPAPLRTNPGGVGPLSDRAWTWSRCWYGVVRFTPGLMMLSIIWTLEPTHCTRFACGT